MLRIFIKNSLRNITRNGAHTAINLLSLTIGITVSIVIYTLIEYQYSFDHFHKNADRVYRVHLQQQNEWGIDYNSQTPEPLHKVLREDYPQIEAVSRTIGPTAINIYLGTDKFDLDDVLFVDEDYFKLFDQEWVMGNPQEAFKDPHALVLTESLAKTFFGDDNPMGKTLDLMRRDKGIVRGVIKDPRMNTNLPYSMLAHVSMMKNVQEYYVRENWYNISIGSTWVLLPEKVDPSSLSNAFQDVVKKNLGEKASKVFSFHLGPLKELHTDNRYGNGVNYTIPANTIYFFLIIGIIILFTCVINFVNLSSAYALKRSKEVGIKKIMGSSKQQLATQFFIELFMITGFATFISLWFAEILLFQANKALSVISIDVKLEVSSVLFAIMLMVVVTFLAGLYPVGLLLRFNPLDVMYSKFTGLRGSKTLVRNTLLTLQFVVAQVLVIVLLIFNNQFSYIKNKDLGFDTDNIISFGNFIPGRYQVDYTNLKAIKSRLTENPYIQKVTFGTGGPNAQSPWSTTVYDPKARSKGGVEADYKHVDIDYLSLFGLKIIAGTWFTENSYQDTLQKVIISRLLVENLGWENPEYAIGRRLNVNGRKARVIGVTEDFHSDNLKNSIRPSVLEGDYEGYNQGFIKIKDGFFPEASSHLSKLAIEVNPDYLPNPRAFEQELAQDYELDQTLFGFINFTTILALAIGSLGLYSLITFVAQQKTKELGIRKVIGANPTGLVLLLASRYLWLILLATLIAAPFGYMGADIWLQGFSYAVDIDPSIFLISFILTSMIAFISIVYRARKAALANPVKSLRYE